MEMVANPAANLQHNTSWTTRGALGRLAASMPMWKMRSAAKRSVKTAATPAVKTAATLAATRGPTSGADPDSNEGAQLRPTPGRKPRNSETKDSRSATWSSKTEDSRSAAWNSETLDLHSVAEIREAGQKRNVGFVEHNTPQRPQREQGVKQCGVQRENRAPAELSAWALNTHDLLWETQDLRRENKDLRLRLQRLETRLVILETTVDRKEKGDVQRTSIMPKTLESSPEVGTQTPASRSRRWRR